MAAMPRSQLGIGYFSVSVSREVRRARTRRPVYLNEPVKSTGNFRSMARSSFSASQSGHDSTAKEEFAIPPLSDPAAGSCFVHIAQTAKADST
jgi:hypothetical protein